MCRQAEVRRQWRPEVISNQQTFEALAQMSVTERAVFQDSPQAGGLQWRRETRAVIELLHEQLISRLIKANKDNSWQAEVALNLQPSSEDLTSKTTNVEAGEADLGHK